MTRPVVIVDPADVRKLVNQWLDQARLIEQADTCAACPVGGVPFALRECARDALALLTEKT